MYIYIQYIYMLHINFLKASAKRTVVLQISFASLSLSQSPDFYKAKNFGSELKVRSK